MRVRAALETLVSRHRLHDGDEVSLAALEEAYVIREADLLGAGVAAVGVPPVLPGEATKENPAVVLIDRRLGDEERRLAYAHEVGHIACGHAGTLLAREVSRLLHDKQEREAWRFACGLLVPPADLANGATAAEIAARRGVPAELVEHHPFLDWVRGLGRSTPVALAVVAALVGGM